MNAVLTHLNVPARASKSLAKWAADGLAIATLIPFLPIVIIAWACHFATEEGE